MIDLTKMNDDALEQFERKIKKGKYSKGVSILYHEGDFSDQVAFTRLGKIMQSLAGFSVNEYGKKVVDSKAAFVTLHQKKISDEPRKYCYMAVVS